MRFHIILHRLYQVCDPIGAKCRHQGIQLAQLVPTQDWVQQIVLNDVKIVIAASRACHCPDLSKQARQWES